MKKQITKGYKDYLKSEKWKMRREAFYKLFGKVCAKCKSTKSIQLHHKTYENIMRELDEDLIPLCTPCHNIFHKIFSKTSVENTKTFLELDIAKYESYKREEKIQKKLRKVEKKKLLLTKPKEITYQGRGKFKRLSKRGVRKVKLDVLDEPMFDFMKQNVINNLNKKL